MSRYENGQSHEPIKFTPTNPSKDGRSMYQVYPGPEELINAEAIVEFDKLASNGTKSRQAPMHVDEFGHLTGPGWRNRNGI